MNNQLVKARVQAFAIQAGSLITIAVLGVLMSPDFKALITEHFGDTFVTSAAWLLLTGVVSHIRNLSVLKKFGATKNTDSVILI